MSRKGENKPVTCQACGGSGNIIGVGRRPEFPDCEEHISTILRQCQDIEELKDELQKVIAERDSLLCEIGELKCEIQAIDLKRITNVHSTSCRGRSALDMACYNGSGNANNTNNNPNSNNNSPTASTACSPPWNQMTSSLVLKNCTLRGDEILKRSRVQAGYELSQDLLDKRIELLERKYGGVRAREAALTIQRAFRRFTLVRRFATITAMAKVEKRLSRCMSSTPEGSPTESGAYRTEGTRSMPSRSMSMRERRNIDVMPLVRSQSGRCDADIDSYASIPPQQRRPYCATVEFDADGRKVSRHGSQVRSASLGTPPSRHAICHSKVPPEVPKRTSSISTRGPLDSSRSASRSSRLSKSRDNGSASSMHSSGSDSSLSTERNAHGDGGSENDLHRGSPIWKRKGQSNSPDHTENCGEYTVSELSRSHTSAAYQLPSQDHVNTSQPNMAPHVTIKVSETIRKRQYRVGLNLFNKKPEKGIEYLVNRGFLENSPSGVARFLISRKGLSKQMIGEYLGNLQNKFNVAVLDMFCSEIDFSNMPVDVALRRFQTYFRLPGEAQKIHHMMEKFSQRYCQCDAELSSTLRCPCPSESIFVLSYSIVMLNTDLHTPNLKPERKMKLEEFIRNLRGVDAGVDFDRDMLVGIYERVKQNEFKPGSDHVTQVMKVQATIVGKKPNCTNWFQNLALPHRRLVCYCRLYEIPDITKKERPGVHQREVFLFNDLLVITKILNKKKGSTTYTFRQSFPLCGMLVTMFTGQFFQFGIRLCQRVDSKELVVFNARNEHDRCKFAEDLRESINEMDDMEGLRIDAELERQKSSRGSRGSSGTGGSGGAPENRDSGVADIEVCPCTPGESFPPQCSLLNDSECSEDSRLATSRVLRRTALSNSLLDIHLGGEKPQQRRGSMGSLDSGMSVSFPSMSSSTVNHDTSKPGPVKLTPHQPSFLGGLFAKRERKPSRSEDPSVSSRSTDV